MPKNIAQNCHCAILDGITKLKTNIIPSYNSSRHSPIHKAGSSTRSQYTLCILFLFAHLLHAHFQHVLVVDRSTSSKHQQHVNCLFAVALPSYASRSCCNRNKLVDKTKRRLKRKYFRFHRFNQSFDYKCLVCAYYVSSCCLSVNCKENNSRAKFKDMLRAHTHINM